MFYISLRRCFQLMEQALPVVRTSAAISSPPSANRDSLTQHLVTLMYVCSLLTFSPPISLSFSLSLHVHTYALNLLSLASAVITMHGLFTSCFVPQEAEFVKYLTQDQPTAPQYFPFNVHMNVVSGYYTATRALRAHTPCMLCIVQHRHMLLMTFTYTYEAILHMSRCIMHSGHCRWA